MTELATETRAVVIERELPHAPAKVWRALTQGPLIEAWLMTNDFAPVVGHRFTFRTEPHPYWNGVTDCEVLAVEPTARLAYSWNASGEEAAGGLRTVITWTLTRTEKGTHLRLEHTGFRPQDERNFQGAGYGWQRLMAELERVVAGLD